MIGLILCVSNKYVQLCTFLPINAGKGTPAPPPDMHPIFTKSINWKKKLGQIVLLLSSPAKNVLLLIALRELHSYTYKELSSSIFQSLCANQSVSL